MCRAVYAESDITPWKLGIVFAGGKTGNSNLMAKWLGLIDSSLVAAEEIEKFPLILYQSLFYIDWHLATGTKRNQPMLFAISVMYGSSNFNLNVMTIFSVEMGAQFW